MTYEKTNVGVLIGSISVIVAFLVLILFVPVSTIFLALVIGLLFAFPVTALILVLISGTSIVSKKMRKLSKSEKEPVVIYT
ncbi:Uncharacterised protein [uncultured archaeon]|nr:Uncharacterised protein [uncultured archaeon]